MRPQKQSVISSNFFCIPSNPIPHTSQLKTLLCGSPSFHGPPIRPEHILRQAFFTKQIRHRSITKTETDGRRNFDLETGEDHIRTFNNSRCWIKLSVVTRYFKTHNGPIFTDESAGGKIELNNNTCTFHPHRFILG